MAKCPGVGVPALSYSYRAGVVPIQ